ncbi:hypothetical protein ACHAQJ_009907 [Trichoderma viride]
MSGDDGNPGDDASSLKDSVVDAQEGISLPIVHDDDDDDEEISEASTLLPSRGPSSLVAQQRQQDDEAEEGQVGPWMKMKRFLGMIFSAVGMLRMGLFAGMAAMVILAVMRAMGGEFSPGLVAGGGLMMILCLVVNKRDARGGLAIESHEDDDD